MFVFRLFVRLWWPSWRSSTVNWPQASRPCQCLSASSSSSASLLRFISVLLLQPCHALSVPFYFTYAIVPILKKRDLWYEDLWNDNLEMSEVCVQPWCNPLWLTGLKELTNWLTLLHSTLFTSSGFTCSVLLHPLELFSTLWAPFYFFNFSFLLYSLCSASFTPFYYVGIPVLLQAILLETDVHF